METLARPRGLPKKRKAYTHVQRCASILLWYALYYGNTARAPPRVAPIELDYSIRTKLVMATAKQVQCNVTFV
jgi:hypothetical protein